MREFYGHLGARGPVEALRQAQQVTRGTFAHSFAWAGFSLTGMAR